MFRFFAQSKEKANKVTVYIKLWRKWIYSQSFHERTRKVAAAELTIANHKSLKMQLKSEKKKLFLKESISLQKNKKKKSQKSDYNRRFFMTHPWKKLRNLQPVSPPVAVSVPPPWRRGSSRRRWRPSDCRPPFPPLSLFSLSLSSLPSPLLSLFLGDQERYCTAW